MQLAQNNAPCHVARETIRMLNKNHVRRIPWPAKSPDFNPNEHLRDYMGRIIRRGPEVRNVRHLQNRLAQVWNNIAQQVFSA